jgi:outer membrane scaffolding protein for murein synthesis (MipA/OmpV family)
MQTSNVTRRLAVIAAIALILTTSWLRTAYAAQEPLWEFGLGVGALAFPDYRGADTAHAFPVPVPYFVYRGKFLQADHNGLEGRLFDQDRVKLNISMNATPPVGRSSTRQGMPGLRPTLEIGPSLEVGLWRSTDEGVKVDIRLPTRAVYTIEAMPRGIGWFFAPHVNMDIKNVVGLPGWNLGFLAGPLFADKRYHDYFYSVDSKYATAERPAYEAHGGYSGAQTLASISKRYSAHWIGAYVRYDSLSGATFTASPLVKRDSYWSTGVAVVWMIRQSSQLVDAED